MKRQRRVRWFLKWCGLLLLLVVLLAWGLSLHWVFFYYQKRPAHGYSVSGMASI